MEKWISLLCANMFFFLSKTTFFNFTLTFSLGANNLSDNVTLSIIKRVKGTDVNSHQLCVCLAIIKWYFRLDVLR